MYEKYIFLIMEYFYFQYNRFAKTIMKNCSEKYIQNKKSII